MEEYSTSTGDRPDLQAIEVNTPEGYIGNRVYPVFNVYEPGSTFSYAQLTTDRDPEQARTRGAELERRFITMAQDSYVTASQERRFSVDWRDVKILGGIERADRQGGIMSKRSIMFKLEGDQATRLFTGPPAAIGADPLATIMGALPDLKRYSGKPAMVLSYAAWRWFVSQKAVLDKLKYFGWTGPSAEAVLSVQRKVVLAMLQNVYGITEVLVGDDDVWQTVAGHMALVKLPPPEEMSHVEGAILGKTIVYLPDPATNDGPIRINSAANHALRCNDFDAIMQYAVREFAENTGAKILFTGLGATGT